MQIRLIVRSKGGDETYEKGDRDEYGFCPFVAHSLVEG